MVRITISTGRGSHGCRKPRRPNFVYRDCACNGVGCRACNHKGRVGVIIPPNPPKRCRACNGMGCGACNSTGWMNGFAL